MQMGKYILRSDDAILLIVRVLLLFLCCETVYVGSLHQGVDGDDGLDV